MRRLVRTALDREVEFRGREYRIAPPTVRDAAEIVVSVKGAASGEPSNLGVFREAVRRWLPFSLASVLLSESVPIAQTIENVLAWVMEGAPVEDLAENLSDEDQQQVKDPLDVLLRSNFAGMLADYAAAYGCDPETVYHTCSWTSFFLFHQLHARAHARRSYEYLTAKGIPHIRDRNKQRDAWADLVETAGLKDGERLLTREDKIERSKQQWAALRERLPNVMKN